LSTGRQSRKAVFYNGIAIVPSQIVRPSGAYRLLAVPELDFADASLPLRSRTMFRLVLGWTGWRGRRDRRELSECVILGRR